MVLAGLSLWFAACDLRHWKERRYCQAADGDPARCAARPDWCWSMGGPVCDGSGCPSRYCQPRDGGCVAIETREARCPADGRFVIANRVADLSRYEAWKRRDLSPAAWALSGRELTREIVESLSESDREQLCGSVLNPCRLEWDAAAGHARCLLRADACSSCVHRVEPYRCYPKNLCADVICP